MTYLFPRAELSPQVDVAVDVSESMFFHEERAARTRGLLQFCLLSAIGTGKIKNVLLSDCVLPPNAKLLLSRYDALTISNLHTEEAQATSRYSATL